MNRIRSEVLCRDSSSVVFHCSAPFVVLIQGNCAQRTIAKWLSLNPARLQTDAHDVLAVKVQVKHNSLLYMMDPIIYGICK